MFASEYGYDIDQFFKLTLKQLNFLIERITARKHNEFATKTETYANLQGGKIKIPRIKVNAEEDSAPSSETSINDEYAEKRIRLMLEKKQADKARGK